MTLPTLSEFFQRWEKARREGRDLTPEELGANQPEILQKLREGIAALKQMSRIVDPDHSSDSVSSKPGKAPAEAPPSSNLAPEIAANMPPGYELIEELGRGGMGVVYRVRQRSLNRIVALKMILAGVHARDDDRARFLGEAEAIARVQHSGIVQIFEFGTHAGLAFFTMELCEGGPLTNRFDDGPLSPIDAAQIVEQVALAMQAAHDAGIVHRDLKPSNVLMMSDGTVRVTDFGLAKRLNAGSHTETGEVIGTAAYMAPEQAMASKEIGPAADVWAMGAILYACLTGRPPFQAATSLETLFEVKTYEPPQVRQLNGQVPADLETICHRCLRKEPQKRYPSAAELADDLRRWREDRPIKARPVGWPERVVKWIRRNPWPTTVAGGFAASLLIGSPLFAWQYYRTNRAQTINIVQEKEIEHQEIEIVLTKLKVLIDAEPEAVPAILVELDKKTHKHLPHLRRSYKKEQDLQRKMLIGLAILPHDSVAIRDDLVAWMIKNTNPAELLLIRWRLNPYSVELIDQLKKSKSLGALVALALFDPDNECWRETAETTLRDIQANIKTNDTNLQWWIKCFRPVRDKFLQPLQKLFQSTDIGESVFASRMLADYASDNPDLLTELLIQSRPSQLEPLRFALVLYRDRIIANMRIEVKKAPDSWKDAPIKLGPDLHDRIQKAGGLIAERFALCQSLPLEQLESLTNALGPMGYRPVRVHPDNGQVAVIWTRDGKASQICTALKADEIATAKQPDMIPVDVASYTTEDGERYIAIWVKSDNSEKAIHYTGLKASSLTKYIDQLRKKEMQVDTIHGLVGKDGILHYSGVLSQRTNESPKQFLTLDEHPITFKDHVSSARQLLLDATAYQAPIIPLHRPNSKIVKNAWHAAESFGFFPVWQNVDLNLARPIEPSILVEVARARVRAAHLTHHVGTCWMTDLASRSVLGLPLPFIALDNATKHLAAAEEYLQRALDAGATDATDWPLDPHFAALRGRPYFKRLTQSRSLDNALRYTGIWSEETDRESTALHGLTPKEHLNHCKELASQGWQPVGISMSIGLAVSVWHRPAPTSEHLFNSGRRRAMAALMLLLQNQPDGVWELWRNHSDPTVQSLLTLWAGPLKVNSELLIKHLQKENDAGIRRALILALNEYTETAFPPSEREELVPKLLDWYRNDPDPGVHSAINWLLGHAKEGEDRHKLFGDRSNQLNQIDAELAIKGIPISPKLQPGWITSSNRITLTLVPGPLTFTMGSRPWESPVGENKNNNSHVRFIGHSFAIASKLVTIGQWEEFLKDNSIIHRHNHNKISIESNYPITSVTLFDAMAYCNWLSKREDIPPQEWCYPEKIGPDMILTPGWWKRKGYRLPFAAEWEYTARAGATTTKAYGEGELPLDWFGWSTHNSKQRTWPVGQKRPNALGMFDYHGPVKQWCQDIDYPYWKSYRLPIYDFAMYTFYDTTLRELRGGYLPKQLHTSTFNLSERFFKTPGYRDSSIGFRVCKTYNADHR